MDKARRADGSSPTPLRNECPKWNGCYLHSVRWALDLLNYILPHIPGSLLAVENTSGRSTPLHWAAVNAHLSIAQAIVSHPGGPGSLLINAHNAAGRSPLGEAELAGADDVAKWFVEVMMIEQGTGIMEEDAEGENQASDGPAAAGPGKTETVVEAPAELHSPAIESLDRKAEKLTLSEIP